MPDPQQLHHLLPEVNSSQGTGGVTSGVLQAGAPGNPSHGLPGAVSAGAPPRWSGAVAVAAAHVSMGAGEEPRLGREGLLARKVVASQGHGWLLKIVRG